MKMIDTSSLKNDLKFKNKDELKYKNKKYKIVELDLNNIARLSLSLAYYKEDGYTNFAIVYNFKKCKVPYAILIRRMRLEYIYKLIKEYNFHFLMIGFPRCIYERMILKPHLRWYFEKNITFYENKTLFNITNFTKISECHICAYNNKCKGINKEYIKNYNDKEFQAIILNNEFYKLNLNYINTRFKNKRIKEYAKLVLEDFKADSYYLRKKFILVDSFPKDLEESSVERFAYYIYNRKDDFNKTFKFFGTFFDLTFLKSIKKYLQNSDQFSISFGLMGNSQIRKSIYFSLNNFSLNMMKDISNKFNLQIFYERTPAVLGIDFWKEKVSFKVYYRKMKITQLELKNFVKEFAFEDKRKFLKFSNSILKPLNEVLLDYKYLNNEIISKRVDVSLQFNHFRVSQFYTLFAIPISFFGGKDLYTLSFEVKKGSKEKINFYYTLALPDEEEEIEEH